MATLLQKIMAGRETIDLEFCQGGRVLETTTVKTLAEARKILTSRCREGFGWRVDYNYLDADAEPIYPWSDLVALATELGETYYHVAGSTREFACD